MYKLPKQKFPEPFKMLNHTEILIHALIYYLAYDNGSYSAEIFHGNVVCTQNYGLFCLEKKPVYILQKSQTEMCVCLF